MGGLSAAERERLIGEYAAGPQRLRRAVEEAPESMRKWRPAEGEFSVHEVAVHCADSETTSHGRIRFLVAQPDPTIIGYDPDGWAKALDYHEHPLEAALATVEAVRANTTPLLRRLPDAAWTRSGTHTESGPYSAEDWLRIYAAHVDEHTAQVRAVVQAWESAGRPG